MAIDQDRLYIALYADADVHGKLAEQIRQKGFDAVSAYEAGNAELDDSDQLEYAISQKRVILTCNAKDFAPLFDQYWLAGKDHCGIIISQQLSLGEFLQRILKLLNTVSADEMQNNFKNLAEFATKVQI